MSMETKNTEVISQQNQTTPATAGQQGAVASRDPLRSERIESAALDIDGMKNTFLSPVAGRVNLRMYANMLLAYIRDDSFAFHGIRGDAEGLINAVRQSCSAPSHADRHNELTEERKRDIETGVKLTDELLQLIRSST